MPSDQRHEGKVRFIGSVVEEGSVPVEVFFSTLKSLQQAVYVVGLARLEQPIRQRFRLSTELKQRFQLRMGVPSSGSFVQPVWVDDARPQQQIADQALDVLGEVWTAASAISEGRFSKLNALLPDPTHRERLISAFESLAPEAGVGWEVKLSSNGSDDVTFNPRFRKRIFEARAASESEEDHEETLTVTGELIRIDFSSYTLTLKYPPTKKEIKCSYRPAIESMIIEKRRDLIQVTGSFTLDDEGHPKELSDVSRIVELDLSPIVIERFEGEHGEWIVDPPLHVQPEPDPDTKQHLFAEDESLNISAFGQTREELATAIEEQIEFLWESYVDAPEADLAESARTLRAALQGRIRRVG